MKRAFTKGLVGFVVGAAAGAAFVFVTQAVLFHLGFVRRRAVVGQIFPALWMFFPLFGALIGAFGKRAAEAFESLLLPRELDDGARKVFRVGFALSLLAVAFYHVSHFLLRTPVDLPSFVLAARALGQGADIYDPAVLATMGDGPIEGGLVLPYLYLPLYAVLLRPLSLLPLPAGFTLFLFLNAVTWPALVYLSFRLVEVPERLKVGFAALGCLLTASFLPAIQTLHHGSPSLLIALLVVAALVLDKEDKPRWAGICLALAVLIKVVPGLVLVYLAIKRRWATLIATAAFGAVFLVLSIGLAGWDLHLRWVTEIAPGLASGAHTGTWFEPARHPENQSITGLIFRFGGAQGAELKSTASLVSALVALLALGVIALRRTVSNRLESSLCLVAMLLVSTITWFHHMTLMLPVILTLVIEATTRQGWRAAALAAVALFVMVTVGFEFLYDPFPFVVPNPIFRSVRFLAMATAYVTTLGLLVAGLRRKPSEEAP